MKLLDKVKSFVKGEKSLSSMAGYPLYLSGGYIPTSWPWNWWQQGRDPLRNDGCATVYACSAAYAQTIATCASNHWRKKADGGRQLISNSPLANFLNRPNSYQTRSDFMLNLVQQLMLDGNAYAVGFRDSSGRIESAHLLHSRYTMPYIEPETKEIFYGIGNGQNPLIPEQADNLEYMVPARDVLHIRLYTPNHPLNGVSPVQYAAAAVAANMSITSHQALFFQNMSRPSGVITTDQVLNREQLSTLRSAWKEQSQGLNSGQVPILHAGMKWESMSISSQDAQLVEAFAMTVEDIARAFRVPLPLIGDNRYSTYNNVEQLISSWLSTGLGFVLEHTEASIATWFGLPKNEFVNFDTDALLRTDFAGRIDGLTKAISGGLYSPNEARAKEGLAAVEDGDEPRLQSQVVPLSNIGAIPSEPPGTIDTSDTPPDDVQQAMIDNILRKNMEAA